MWTKFIKRWPLCPRGFFWKPIFYSFFITDFCKKKKKKIEGWKRVDPPSLRNYSARSIFFKWWLPKVTKFKRNRMLDCWTMSVVFTWEDDEMDIQCVPVHSVVSHGFQGLTIKCSENESLSGITFCIQLVLLTRYVQNTWSRWERGRQGGLLSPEKCFTGQFGLSGTIFCAS